MKQKYLKKYYFYLKCWFFGCDACGILAPRPGIKPTPPASEGEGLTTGSPGKSLLFVDFFFLTFIMLYFIF